MIKFDMIAIWHTLLNHHSSHDDLTNMFNICQSKLLLDSLDGVCEIFSSYMVGVGRIRVEYSLSEENA